MLWVNLIMDILGAIALGTEKYQKGGKFTRLARSNPRVLVMEHNWRQVLVHALFQITVMLFLMYLGQFIFFDEGFNLINPSPQGGVNRDDDRKKLDTICFHVFILMNLFNMINCRVLDTADHTEKNVFKTLCKFKMGCPPLPEHSIFWVILGGEILLQHIIINTGVGETLFNCAELTTTEQVICWVIGSLSLPVNLIVKSIQVDKFAFVQSINLERIDETEFINRFMGWFEAMQKKLVRFFSNEGIDLNEDKKIEELFMKVRDADNLVSTQTLKKLLKEANEAHGIKVTDE